MINKDKKILVIGGGPAGCSAAAYALQQGFTNVTLLEGAETLGGLHKDVEINGLHYDLGAFFFWKDHNILTLFPEIKPHLVYAGSARHLTLTKHFNLDKYPLSLPMYLRENGRFQTVWDLTKLLISRVLYSSDQDENVEGLMTYYMGPFYVKSGLKNYVKRLYNMEPRDVHAEFAKKRMRKVIEKCRFRNIVRAVGRGEWRYVKQYDIVPDNWARPEGGFEKLYEVITETLRAQNCNVLLNQFVRKIDLHEKIAHTASGTSIAYDYIISTQALTATATMSGVPFDLTLKYRALCSLFYEMPAQVMENCFVLFNFTDKGKWKRITFHSNYYNLANGSTQPRHYFVVESMPCEEQMHSSQLASELDMDFKATFENTKWGDTFKKAKLTGHRITPNAYPVFDTNFRRDKILAFKTTMSDHNVYMVGRQGEFEHTSSSDASRSAISAVDTIMEKERSLLES